MASVTIDLPRPHVAQQEVLNGAKRFNVVACGRRWGKTDMGINLAVETMLDGLPVGWFAPTYKLLEEAWDRFDTVLPKQAIDKVNKAERMIRLRTGGQVDFWTLKPITKDQSVAGRGRKYKMAIVDEASMAPNLKSDWNQAIRPTLTDLLGTAWFMFTPRGQNYAHVLFRKGQADDKDWASFQMPTVRNPFIAPSEVEDAKRDLPADAFEQEYLAQFLSDAANPFGVKAIEACIAELSSGPVSHWGADLAKSVDYTVCIGLDSKGTTAIFDRWQSDWMQTRIRLAGYFKRSGAALVDSTGVGDTPVEDLQRACGNVTGYHFTSLSKQRLMEGLAYAIQNKLVQFPEGEIVEELKAFQYEYRPSGVRYTAPQGLHDDCVCALALAVYAKMSVPQFDFRIIDTAGKPYKPKVESVDRAKETEQQRGERFQREMNDSRFWSEVEV